MGGVLFITPPAFLYKDGVGVLVKSHLSTLPNPFRDKETNVLERDSAILFIMAFPPFRDTEEMADQVRETFKWHLRGPRVLLGHFRKITRTCARASLYLL